MDRKSSKDRSREIPPGKLRKLTVNPMHLFDLPLEHIFRNIAEHLPLRNLLNFGKCSKFCNYLADKSLVGRSRIVLHRKTGNENFCSREMFHLILKKCKNLRKISIIDLPWRLWFTDDLLSQLIINNPLLEIFSIYSYSRSLAVQITRITSEGVEPLIHCKHLYALRLDYTVCNGDFMKKLCEHNNQLKEFQVAVDGLSKWCAIEDSDIVNFLAKEPQLRYMRVLDQDFDVVHDALLKHCPELRRIYLTNFCWESYAEEGEEAKCVELISKFVRRCTVTCPKLHTIALPPGDYVFSDDLHQHLERHNVRLIFGYFDLYQYYEV